MNNLQSTISNIQFTIPAMRIEFIASPRVFCAAPRGGLVEPGTWEIGFFPTRSANPAKGIDRLPSPIARFWRASEDKTRQQAIEAIAQAADKEGFCGIEIFSVSRILKQVQWNEN